MSKYVSWLLGGSLLCGLFLIIFYATMFLRKNTQLGANKELTLAMIKPDAVEALNTGKIIDRIEQEGFSIVALKKTTIQGAIAQEFYVEHKEKSFYQELVNYITSGPVVLMILSKKNAVKKWRDLMGSTNPDEAAPNTLRRLYGLSIGQNAVHGSDSLESAKREIGLLFQE